MNADVKKHWSVDTSALQDDPEAFAVWQLEQRINWGIGERTIDRVALRRYWNIIDIDPLKRQALALALS